MERIEDLNLNGLKIIQDDSLYCFTSDAVLLSKFANVKKGDVVADFCSGSGIVGLNLYGLNANLVKSVTLFEMQTSLFEMSKKTIELNKLQDVFTPVNTRVQDILSDYNERFSLIVCNPPYMPANSGMVDNDLQIAICKSEIELTLCDLVKSIAKALKFGGRVCMCHRADRLADVMYQMKLCGIEPKRLQTVNAKNKQPYLILIEGVKGGKSGLKILNPLEN